MTSRNPVGGGTKFELDPAAAHMTAFVNTNRLDCIEVRAIDRYTDGYLGMARLKFNPSGTQQWVDIQKGGDILGQARIQVSARARPAGGNEAGDDVE